MIGRQDYVGTCRQPFIAFADCPKTCTSTIVELSIQVFQRRCSPDFVHCQSSPTGVVEWLFFLTNA